MSNSPQQASQPTGMATRIQPPMFMVENGDGGAAEKWRRWRKRWQSYATVTGLDAKGDDYKLACLNSAMSDEALDLIDSLPYENSGDENDIGKVLDLLEKHYVGATNEIYESYKFFQRSQEDGEPVTDYIAAVRAQAGRCNFNALKNRLIRDRIVCGIRDKGLQRSFLEDSKLTLEKCVEKCKAAEQAKKHTAEITADPNRPASKGEQQDVFFARQTTWDKRQSHPGNRQHFHNGTSGARSVGSSARSCSFCGLSHAYGPQRCPAKGKLCHRCGKPDHFAIVCRVGKKFERHGKQSVYWTVDDQNKAQVPDVDEEILSMGQSAETRKRLFVDVNAGGKLMSLQIDTGATCNVLRKADVPPGVVIQGDRKPASLTLFDGSTASTLGLCFMDIRTQSGKTLYDQKFQVVADGSSSLLGAQAAQQLGLISTSNEVYSLSRSFSVARGMTREDFISKFPKVFGEQVGRFQGSLRLYVDQSVQPSHMSTRRFPIAIKDRLEKELERLERLDVIEATSEPSEWTSALAVTHKQNGDLRVCIDPRGLNKALQRVQHPVPTVEELVAEVANAKVFSKCDVRNGFWHVELDDESSRLTTFSTPFGRYRWKRMPFGIAPASELFQRKLEQQLEGLAGVKNIHDDILVFGEGNTVAEAISNHDERMCKLLQRCEERNIALNSGESKFILKEEQLPYMGHIFSPDGLRPDPAKIKAITDMPSPDGPAATRRFLGMVNYLAKFIPTLSDLCHPLRQAISKEEWNWNQSCDKAITEIKEAILKTGVLRYLHPTAKITVQCDASSLGLGAAILQEGKPVAFASRALSSAEKNYSQLEKEMLAIVFALRRFDQYVYGREILVIYGRDSCVYGREILVEQQHTRNDTLMVRLKTIIQDGWPINRSEVPLDLMVYYHIRDELAVDGDVILKGPRCVIPRSLRQTIMERIHCGHTGIAGSLQRARMSVFWPGLTADIKNYVLTCETCNRLRQTAQQKETLLQHERPDRPWAKVAADLFSIDKRNFLVTVDYWSNYFELDELRDTASKAVIRCLRRHFATHGIPDELVTDNGPQFTADEFKTFSTSWMFRHTTTSPYHPQSNGLAESTVKTAKKILRTAIANGEDAWLAILAHRNTPTQGMATSPAQRLLSRRTKTLLPVNTDLLLPDTSSRDQDKHDLQQRLDQQKVHYDRKAKDLDTLTPGDQVLVHPKRLGTRVWCEGVVLGKRDEPRSYDIELTSGQKVRRNRRDLRRVSVRHDSSSVCDQSEGPESEPEIEAEPEEEQGSPPGSDSQKKDDTYRLGTAKKPYHITRSGRPIFRPDFYQAG